MAAKLRLLTRNLSIILRAMNISSYRRPIAAALAALCVVGIAGCGGGGGGAKTSTTDAGLIAFDAYVSVTPTPNATPPRHVFTIRADGSSRKLIAPLAPLAADTDVRVPALSPDGELIAFCVGVPSNSINGLFDLYLANSDGSGAHKLDINGLGVEPFGGPAWNPDGQSLIFGSNGTQNSSGRGIYRIGADGSALTMLSESFSTFPSYNQDGTKIVFDRPTDDNVSVMNADGSNAHQVPNTAHADAPIFAPDNSILYSTGITQDSQIFRINSDGSGAQQVTHLAGGALFPTLSPDGKQLAVITAFPQTGTQQNKLVVLNIDGSNPRTLVSDNALFPSWSRSR